MSLLIESQYLPPLPYFAKLLQYPDVIIEKHEHYEKGTYRNRCHIASPHGILRLTVPLQKGKNERLPVKDVKISYDHNWQHLHWRSICSNYRSSSFFEFYEDDFASFYHEKEKYLFDLNQKLFEKLLQLLKIGLNVQFSEKYEAAPENLNDWRSAIHPKKPAFPDFKPKEYMQVFKNETGFLPGLSIIDLLFNEGPQAGEILKLSVQD